MKQKHLESYLSSLPNRVFANPKIELEQYPTSVNLVSLQQTRIKDITLLFVPQMFETTFQNASEETLNPSDNFNVIHRHHP